MIKIDISQTQKDNMEKIIWNDATTAPTGILNELEKSFSKRCLKKYPKLYQILYDANGNVRKDEIKKILLSSRQELEKYINRIGEFSEIEGECLLKNIFKFNSFSKRKVAYEVLKIIDVDVCPYCNRQYITTIQSGKVRAQFDHFYPKKKYPYLALSIFNLIPCCSVCNTAKSNLNTAKEPILYPYEEEFGYDIFFNIRVKNKRDYVRVLQGISDEFEIIINNPSNNDKVERQRKKLHLDELYNEHKSYVEDLLKNQYINTPERIQDLERMFPKLFDSQTDIKNIIYMSDIKKENWNRRPLSKLTFDIDAHIPEF